MAQYLAECKRKMGAACPEPTFVPKVKLFQIEVGKSCLFHKMELSHAMNICFIQTPSKPVARGRGRRGKASLASTSSSLVVEEEVTKVEATEPQRARGRRVTRQSTRPVDK